MQATCLCVLAAVLALVVKRGSPETALLLVLGAAVAVLLSLGQALEEAVAFLEELGRRSGMPEGLLIPLYKVAGIALVVKVGGGLCADAGESALAAVVETAGWLTHPANRAASRLSASSRDRIFLVFIWVPPNDNVSESFHCVG